jgi:hypothetical protein
MFARIQIKNKRIMAAAVCAGLALASISLVAGCSSVTGDTSGYSPPPTQSKADIQKEIAAIQANPKIPPNIKGMAIANEQKKLADAK